ncbi:MAG TPA: ATP-dependent DNA ligase [Actinomycetota bacterium]|nr:ATP-dependent DNA ligase [Actinomycetota bacterium]
MLLADIAETSDAVASTPSRTAKIEALAACLRRASGEEIAVAVAFLSGTVPGGSTGIGWAALRDVPPAAPPPPTLGLLDTANALEAIRELAGRGSRTARADSLAALFGRATEPEHRFLRGLLSGEIRQGALEGVMVEAVARAAGVTSAEVRRAAMLSGDLGVAATAALTEGTDGLGRFGLTPMRPIQPMLAQTAEDIADALARISLASVEWKLDGARIQVHRLGDEVRVFTRNLADVTSRVPEVVAAVRGLPFEALVLDGEAIALRPDERPYAFQVSMSRFGTRIGSGGDVPLSCFFFDILHVDGVDVLDEPLAERAAMLARLPAEIRVPSIVTADVAEAEAFLDDALAREHEGVMVKGLDAPYEAGRRGAGWLKVKRAHALDLVVLAAEWGHGRRRGWLSNLHLGAREPSSGGFVMLGKTFKGMTDEMLAWQTERLQQLETSRDAYTVYVRPELVVEVAFDGLQRSPRYPGGLALRFARIKGYRPDKRPDEADTIQTVRALEAKRAAPPT